jgi:hypothetical protein
MGKSAAVKAARSDAVDVDALIRIAREGYGPGAWHGADFKAALSDVTSDVAFWRPGKGRHNIAEIALHHAYTVRAVCAKLTGATPEPFVLEGADWFEASGPKPLSWSSITDVVATQQRKLENAIQRFGEGDIELPDNGKPLDLVLGIACHAVYHAGQVQLIKVLK